MFWIKIIDIINGIKIIIIFFWNVIDILSIYKNRCKLIKFMTYYNHIIYMYEGLICGR
jgi:hypothetical protein